MIKYNNSNINDWNFGDDNIAKVYYNGNMCYQKVSGIAPPAQLKARLKYDNYHDVTIECNDDSLSRTEISQPHGFEHITEAMVYSCALSINDATFQDCSALTYCTIESGVTNIGSYAFRRCSAITSIDIPDSVRIIGNYAFQDCLSLSSFTIPTSVANIQSGTFQGCSGLMRVTGLKGTIGASAFTNCSSLTSIDISHVSSLSGYAFSDCSSLTAITCNQPSPPPMQTTGFWTGVGTSFNGSSCPIYVPSDRVTTYKTANGWKTYSSRIQAIPNS